MIKVILESLDGNSITPRTGKTKVSASTEKLPSNGDCQIFLYDAEEECESPGVRIATDGLEKLGNEYKFYDDAKRPFKVTILD